MPGRPTRRAVAVFGGLFVAWLLLLLFFDPDLVDDSDLAVPVREIDPAQNPFPEIRNLVFSEEEEEELVQVYLTLRGDETFDPAFLESLLKKHKAALDRFERYAEMRDWRSDLPLDSTDFGSDFGYLNAWQAVARLKRVEAIQRASLGDRAAAFDSALSLFDFADRLQSSEVPTLGSLVANGIAHHGAQTMLDLLARSDVEASVLDTVANDLDRMLSAPATLATVFRSEYQFISRATIDLQTNDLARLLLPFVYKKNRSLALHADLLWTAIDGSDEDFGTFSRAVDGTLPKGRWAAWAQALSGNAFGYEGFLKMPTSINIVGSRDLQRRTVLGLLRLRIALERYRLHYDRWPEDLAELVPDFLNEIPRDRMDGKPLRYDATGRRLYSVGTDLIDTGGVAPDKAGSLRSRLEIVIELEPTTPRLRLDFPQRPMPPEE